MYLLFFVFHIRIEVCIVIVTVRPALARISETKTLFAFFQLEI